MKLLKMRKMKKKKKIPCILSNLDGLTGVNKRQIITTLRMSQLNEFVENNLDGLIVGDEKLFESCIDLLNDKNRLEDMNFMNKKKLLKLSAKDPIKVWQNLF